MSKGVGYRCFFHEVSFACVLHTKYTSLEISLFLLHEL